MSEKIIKKIVFAAIIIALGGFGGILANRYFFPYLGASKFFSKYEIFKKSVSDVTVINKTEQVFVKEESSVTKITNQAAASVVNIIAYPKVDNAKPVAKKSLADKAAVANLAGVIVTSDGMIMSYQPEADAESFSYKAMIYNGNVYDANFLGVDSYSHLAFWKIETNNLPAISFGNSDESLPGEKVIAVGNNFGAYANRYAAGILSNFNPAYNLAGKTVSSSEKLEGVFEADFTAQKNYIGGPLVDYTGQVIGIVGFLDRDNGREYFAIPSNKVKAVIEKAIKKEWNQGAKLGIYFVPITRTYALVHNLKQEKGVLIYSPSGQQGLAVIAGTPAQKAGLQIQDIITAVNGSEIALQKNLPGLLNQYKAGEEIELTVIRNEQEIKIKVQL